MAGRKSKYTPETVDKLLSVLRAGATIKDACAYVGISQETFFQWVNRKPEFSEAVKKAQSESLIEAVTIIRLAAKNNWTAAAWLLERKDPANWGRKDKLIIEGVDLDVIKSIAKQAEEQGIPASEIFNNLLLELKNASSTDNR